MMDGAPYDILFIANPFWDRTQRVDSGFLKRQGLEEGLTHITEDRAKIDQVWSEAGLQQSVYSLGGSGTNVAKIMAWLGHRCKISGRVGSDEKPGYSVEEQLKKIGIHSLLKKGHQPTGVVNCFITKNGQRTMQTYLGCSTEHSVKDIDAKDFKGVTHVHLEGYSVLSGTLERSLAYAEENGASVSIDLASANIVEGRRADFQRLLPKVSHIFGNMLEMQKYTQKDSAKEAAESFPIQQNIVVTTGSDGCWVKPAGAKNAAHFAAPIVKEVVDTTGAGDAFVAGYLHAARLKMKIEDCVKSANLAAAAIIQEYGAELPLHKWTALVSEIKSLSST